jgi:hypothetical protein
MPLATAKTLSRLSVHSGPAAALTREKIPPLQLHREQYPAIHEMVRHLLEAEPVIQGFNVDSSTTHKIEAGKAA